eukprot:g2762.t1
MARSTYFRTTATGTAAHARRLGKRMGATRPDALKRMAGEIAAGTSSDRCKTSKAETSSKPKQSGTKKPAKKARR